jgi:PIN domain nuclease of toxin-antitoxin system
MRALVDTHALLWWLFDDPRLSARAREVMEDSVNEVLVSAASAWEIMTKHRLGRLPHADAVTRDLPKAVRRAGFEPLAISLHHAVEAGRLASPHRDPFDRMLAAQARLEGLPLITDDRAFFALSVSTLW